MTAPTTRETADHAELARIAEQCRLKADKLGCDEWRAPALLKQASRGLEALLSEIAALRGERDDYRLRTAELTGECDALKDNLSAAREDDLRHLLRATQAERQRDEARDTIASTVAKADWMQGRLSGERSSIDRETIELVVSECRAYCHLQALANQGADQ